MKIEELHNDGLARKYRLRLSANTINNKVNEELLSIAKTFKMPGFREGKVPLSLVRRQVGNELLQKQLERTMDESLRTLFQEYNIRPATALEFTIVEAFTPEKGIIFDVSFEAFPKFTLPDFSKLSIDVIQVEITEDDLQKARQELSKRFREFNKMGPEYKANMSDMVVLNIVGTINGKVFSEGKAENVKLELGSGQFIPGFEEKLVGVQAGDKCSLHLTFPDNYPLHAGKPVIFEVEILEVQKGGDLPVLDEEFAKKLGATNMEQVNEALKLRLAMDFSAIVRMRTKKILFDQLDKLCDFEVPQAMLNVDFEAMWKDVQATLDKNPSSINKSEDELRKEYMDIAKRRVKLGLLLAETARVNDITISEQDLQQAVKMHADQMPGREKEVMDFYSKEENIKKLEGPLLEENTVDFILNMASLNTVTVSSSEFTEKYNNT